MATPGISSDEDACYLLVTFDNDSSIGEIGSVMPFDVTRGEARVWKEFLFKSDLAVSVHVFQKKDGESANSYYPLARLIAFSRRILEARRAASVKKVDYWNSMLAELGTLLMD
jgi:hypothetical protein